MRAWKIAWLLGAASATACAYDWGEFTVVADAGANGSVDGATPPEIGRAHV